MTTALIARCQLCGEPMPENEQMFKYHGYSGPCPKPPLKRPSLGVVVEYLKTIDGDGNFWISIRADGKPHGNIGPFSTETARDCALDDLLSMVRSTGATDLPGTPQ